MEINLVTDALNEIIHLHGLIEKCFRREVIDVEKEKSEFMSHFHPDFFMIAASSANLNYHGLENWYSSALGTRLGVEITIVNPSVRFITKDGTVIITFEEEQRFNSQFTSRISTAILQFETNLNKFLWLHLQETWIIPGS